jgi:integrase
MIAFTSDSADSAWNTVFQQFLDSLKSDSTRRNYRTILTALFRSDDGAGTDTGNGNTPPKLPDAYTQAELEAFIASDCRGPNRARYASGDRTPTKGAQITRRTAIRSFYRYVASVSTITCDVSAQIAALPRVARPKKPQPPRRRTRHDQPEPVSAFAFSAESPWGRCLASYLRHVEDHSGSRHSREVYEGTLTRFFATIPPKLPECYTREDVEAFLHHAWHDTEPTAGTINSRLSVLSSFYTYAAAYTYASPDNGQPVRVLRTIAPTAGMTRLKPDIHYRALSTEELKRFFAAIPRDTVIGLRDYALMLCYFWTARRRQEILSLRWGDLEESMIIDKDGTPRRAWLYRWYGKGHSRQQDTAELPQPACEAIMTYLKAAGRIEEMQPGDPIFVAYQRRQDRPLAPSSIQTLIKRYATSAGLDPARISCHSFRHTAARERYAVTHDILDVQRTLRHSSLDMTYRYVSQLTGSADTTAKLLESRFSGL